MSEIKSGSAITKARDAQKVREQAISAADTRVADVRRLINKMAPAIGKALPAVLTPERFTRIVLTAISTNPKLAECTQESLLGAVMTGAQLGVELNTPLGQSYLIPRWNGQKRCNECTFQLGYKGMIDLAYRSGKISTISAQVVYSNDKFEFELGLEPKLVHKPCMSGPRGNAVAYYASYRTSDGGYGFEVMSRDEVDEHRKKYSPSANSSYSPWSTNFDEMAKKTVVKKMLKYAPISTDYQRAVAGDEQVREVSSTFDGDILDEPVIYAEEAVVDTETGEIKE